MSSGEDRKHDGPASFVPVRYNEEQEGFIRRGLLLLTDESWEVWLEWVMAIGHSVHHLKQGQSHKCGHPRQDILDIGNGICLDCAEEAEKWQKVVFKLGDRLPGRPGHLRLVC